MKIKKMKSKLTPVLLAVLLIVQMFLPVQIFLDPPRVEIQKAEAAGDGWLDGWDYRTPIEIDGNTEDLTDYQVQVTLQGTNSSAANYVDFDKVLTGGADIRFTDDDKITEIDFWIEEWVDTSESESATVWVEVPSVPTAGIKTVYVYYGQAGVSSGSDGDGTFEFFDDFEYETQETLSGNDNILCNNWNLYDGSDILPNPYDLTGGVFYNVNWAHPYRALARKTGDQDTVLLESDDGINWTYHSVAFNNGDVYSIGWSVFYDNEENEYVMMYVGPHGDNGEQIGIATSSDLINWTDRGYPTQTASGVPGDVDCFFSSGGAKYNGTYYWFVDEGSGSGWPRNIHQIALYISTDIDSGWTRQKTILEPSASGWDSVDVWAGHII